MPTYKLQIVYTITSAHKVMFSSRLVSLLHCALSCRAVYCNRPCLCDCGFVCLWVGLLPR